MSAVDSYLAVRRAAGYEMVVPEYLLRSYARFAAERGEVVVLALSVTEWETSRGHPTTGKGPRACSGRTSPERGAVAELLSRGLGADRGRDLGAEFDGIPALRRQQGSLVGCNRHIPRRVECDVGVAGGGTRLRQRRSLRTSKPLTP